MSGQFSFEVEDAQSAVVIRPRGALDAYTAPDLRAALLRCLASQPASLVLDASELSVTDDVGLTVLASVAQQSERWPGTRFAVIGASVDVATSIERMGITRYMKICPDRDTAFRELRQSPVPPLTRHRIAPDRNAPSVARAAVQDFCRAHGVGGDGDAAQLVASELVTNAVVHAGTTIDLTLRLVPPLLHIAVGDGGEGQARIATIVDESSESGRGLLLVDALASAWGTFVPDNGKIVWATVPVRSVNRGA
jgi:anti-anti-sigma factor